MLYAEWSGRTVHVYDEYGRLVRTLHARFEVDGVQCSGSDVNDGRVAISMENGKTDLCRANGEVIRLGR